MKSYTDYLLRMIRTKRVSVLIIMFVTILSYINVFSNTFVWDDYNTIIEWQETRTWSSVPKMIMGATPPGHPGNYRPIRNILYIASYQLWGENPWGYHIQTLVLAVSIALLGYGITQFLVPNTFVPLVTAVLFGTHPMHVEALTWMTSMMDMYGMLFGFGAVYTFLAWKKHPTMWGYYIGSIVLTALAIFSNEITLAIPIILGLWVFLFPKKHRTLEWLQLIPFFGVIIGNFYIRAVLLHIGARFIFTENSIVKTMMVMGRAAWVYIQTLVLPIHLTINHSLGTGITSWGVDLYEPGSSGQKAVAALSFVDPIILLSTGILITLVVSAFFLRRRIPLYTFAVGWILIAMVPVSNIIPTEAMMTERYAFLASYGFVFLIAFFASRIANLDSMSTLRSKLVWGSICALLCIYIGMTIQRNADWRSNIILWSVTTKQTPEALLPHLYLADIYFQTNNFEAALKEYLSARELSPNKSEVDLFISAIYHALGKNKEAIIYASYAIKKNPTHLEAYFRLGNLLKKEQQWEGAAEVYNAGLKLYPDHIFMLNNLGVIYSIQGKKSLAIAMYTKALAVDPTYESARVNLEKIQHGDTSAPIESATPPLQSSDLLQK